jgi:hypothetical protein
MQKVEGSNPFSRFPETPLERGFVVLGLGSRATARVEVVASTRPTPKRILSSLRHRFGQGAGIGGEARVSSLRNGRRDPSSKVSRPNVSGHRLSTVEVGRAIRRPRERCRGDGDRPGQAICTSVTLAEADELPKTRSGR